uniref:Uncharacterized protein n=1 Tax=Corvus moneduloides TaxID=1196302 RepID=A0A8U7NRD6_CORMO
LIFQNQIEKIENLDSFPNLRFLCLAGNRIQRVQNLQALPHLSALDLSHNQIRVLDTGGKREDLVVAALPHLLQLDSQPIHGNTAEEEAGGGSSSSNEEELLPELRTPFTVDRGARVGDRTPAPSSPSGPASPAPAASPGASGPAPGRIRVGSDNSGSLIRSRVGSESSGSLIPSQGGVCGVCGVCDTWSCSMSSSAA